MFDNDLSSMNTLFLVRPATTNPRPGPGPGPVITTLAPPTSSKDYFNDLSVCGKPKNSRFVEEINRIVGGVDATPGDLPWQAAMRGGNSGKPFCGATLISKKWAISAAHCQIRRGQQIVLGAHNFRLANEGKSHKA